MDFYPVHWIVYPTADDVANAAYRKIVQAAKEAISQRGQFKLVLAGGTTPEKVYRLLAEAKADWGKWWVYHGDERCLPFDHKDRNSLMARTVWLDKVAIPDEQIFDIPAELGPEEGARQYTLTIAPVLPFNLVLLGMGEDGHTASLFPGHQHNLDDLCHAVFNSPKPPPERVSLSAKALSDAQQVIFLVTGANKQEAVKLWRSGHDLPVASISPANTTVLTDQSTASNES